MVGGYCLSYCWQVSDGEVEDFMGIWKENWRDVEDGFIAGITHLA
jgi:hypothetical protein